MKRQKALLKLIKKDKDLIDFYEKHGLRKYVKNKKDHLKWLQHKYAEWLANNDYCKGCGFFKRLFCIIPCAEILFIEEVNNERNNKRD